MALLEVMDVRKEFGGLVALNTVSFGVTSAQIKAIIGPNGAGKSTLFNIISGVLPPTKGTIRYNGESIGNKRPFEIARRGVSRTFQTPSLFLRMTVLENVMLGRHCRTQRGFISSALRLPGQRREEKAIRDSAMHWLELSGLADHAQRTVSALPFGRRRMVELARAMATEPQLLLLDEPASGLNGKETDELAELILKIKNRGITVLLVEHDMSLVMDISDSILVLHFGVPIAEGTPAEIRDNKDVIAVYLGGEFVRAAD